MLNCRKFPYDGARVIDDFILLVSLCGNDFLPHLPSLDIGEGLVLSLAVDLLSLVSTTVLWTRFCPCTDLSSLDGVAT